MERRRTLRQQRDTARAQRDTMADQRDEALKAADTERFNVRRLARQLAEARDELDAIKNRPAVPVPALRTPSAELRDARRDVMLLRRQTVQLTARLDELQNANEALNREAVDRAGTLAPRGVTA